VIVARGVAVNKRQVPGSDRLWMCLSSCSLYGGLLSSLINESSRIIHNVNDAAISQSLVTVKPRINHKYSRVQQCSAVCLREREQTTQTALPSISEVLRSGMAGGSVRTASRNVGGVFFFFVDSGTVVDVSQQWRSGLKRG
jgi:hypothetical protein